MGWTKTPLLVLLEAIVFDTEKLLDVVGAMVIPAMLKFRMTQFSISRFPPVANTIPSAPLRSPAMVRRRHDFGVELGDGFFDLG